MVILFLFYFFLTLPRVKFFKYIDYDEINWELIFMWFLEWCLAVGSEGLAR